MRVLVIEPHADDAFLSLGWHLQTLWRKWDRTILTVYSTNVTRANEALQYAWHIGAKSICLGLQETNLAGEKPLDEVPELVPFLTDTECQWDLIAAPLGIQHPDHLAVNYTTLYHWSRVCCLYLDVPYCTKRAHQGLMRSLTTGWTIRSISFPPGKKWNLAGVFVSQGRFMYYNQKARLCPEILLSSSPPTVAQPS